MQYNNYEDIEEMFSNKDARSVKNHFRYARCWKCCGGEHCISNRKVAGRKGLVHNNTKSKTNK